MLPSDYDARKNLPMFTVLAAYFPDAIEALVGLCVQGNVQHQVDEAASNPFKLKGDPLTWDRSKSMDQMNTLFRHLWDHERAKRSQGRASPYDVDGILHATKAFWRAGAELQLTIERLRAEDSRKEAQQQSQQGAVAFGGLVPAGTLAARKYLPPEVAESNARLDQERAAAACGGQPSPARVDSKTHASNCQCHGCMMRRAGNFINSNGG